MSFPDTITDIYGKVEMDLINYASKYNDATITSSSNSGYSNTWVRCIDGKKDTQTNHVAWFQNIPFFIYINFNQLRTINKIAIYMQSNSLLKTYALHYATDSGLTNWVAWTGLQDKSADFGFAHSPIIVAQSVSNPNNCQINILHNSTNVDAYGVRILVSEVWNDSLYSTYAFLTEIEITRTVDLTTYLKTSGIDKRKDFLLNNYSASAINLTLDNKDRRFSPSLASSEWESGFYNDEIKTGNKIRYYMGISGNTILGHYFVDRWDVSSRDKTVQVSGIDVINKLKAVEVELPTTISENQKNSYWITYLLQLANIHDYEMDIQDSDIFTTQYYLPIGKYVYADLIKLTEATPESEFKVSPTGRVQFNIYAKMFIGQKTDTPSISGTRTNINILNSRAMPVKMFTRGFEGDPTNLPAGYNWHSDGTVINLNAHFFLAITDTTLVGSYTSVEIDTGCYSSDNPIGNLFSVLILDVQSVGHSYYDIATHSVAGFVFDDYIVKTGEFTVNYPSWNNIDISAVTFQRYVKIRLRLDTTNALSNNFRVYQAKLRFNNQGTYVSPSIDFGTSLNSYGAAMFVDTGSTTPLGQLAIATRTSANNVDWDSWLAVSNGEISSTVQRYLQIRYIITYQNETLERTGYGILSSIFNYFIGTNNRRFTSFKTIKLESLKQSFLTEFNNDSVVKNKITVRKGNLIAELTTSEMWSDLSTTNLTTGQAYQYTINLSNPCTALATDKLTITVDAVDYDFAVGTNTAGGITVILTSHPTKPSFTITANSSVEITAIKFIAYKMNKIVRQSSVTDDNSINIYGLNELIVDNDYIHPTVASRKLKMLRLPVSFVIDFISVEFDDDLDLGMMILLSEYETGIHSHFEIIGLQHSLDISENFFMPKTKLQLRFFDLANYQNTGYWGMGKYWGSDEGGIAKYWGGSIYE